MSALKGIVALTLDPIPAWSSACWIFLRAGNVHGR